MPRLKLNPIRGRRPVLQNCTLGELEVDAQYQRSTESQASRRLIKMIAQEWDWRLCQPLVVALRKEGDAERLFVVDGQHRLAAARLRRDIYDLPCVVTQYAGQAEEAASFVALNRRRQPLSSLQIFKAARAAGEPEALKVVAAAEAAGLRIANGNNLDNCPPGALSNVAGLEACLRSHGQDALRATLRVLAQAFPEQVLRFAGTIFPGLAAIVAAELKLNSRFAEGEFFELMVEMVAGGSQADWVRDINQAMTDERASSRKLAAILVFSEAWAECREAMLDEAA